MRKSEKAKDAPNDPSAPGYTAHWATFWRVTQQAIRDWLRNEKMPSPHDIEGMLQYAAMPGKKQQGFIEKVAELRASGHKAGGVKFVDPDWQEFIGNRPATASTDPLEVMRDYYQFKLRKANESADENGIRIYSDLVIKYEKAIRDNKLAADKLGIEEGQLFTKDQLAKFIRAFAFWSMRGNDAVIADVCPKMVAGFKSVNDARNTLEPVLLSERFVKPFARAARVESDSSLAGWMVETVKDAVDDFVESKDEKFADYL